jgi:hypothetical protein
VYEAKIVRSKHQVLVVAGIVLVVAAAVALAVGIPMRMAQQSAAAATRSTQVLDLDLVPVASLAKDFGGTLSASTLRAISQDFSAQAKAYQWLVAGGHPDLPKYEALPRMLHRFALATVFYATNGSDRWRIITGWLERGLHECLWHGVNSTRVGEDAVSYCKDEEGVLDETFEQNTERSRHRGSFLERCLY